MKIMVLFLAAMILLSGSASAETLTGPEQDYEFIDSEGNNLLVLAGNDLYLMTADSDKRLRLTFSPDDEEFTGVLGNWDDYFGYGVKNEDEEKWYVQKLCDLNSSLEERKKAFDSRKEINVSEYLIFSSVTVKK